MSFVSEQRIARLRPRGGKLFFPMVLLFAVSFALSFLYGRFVEQWQVIAMWSVAGALVILFWLIPVLRWAGTFLEVTTTRVIYRAGIFGSNRIEIPLAQITNVELTPRRTFTIIANGMEPTVIAGIGKHKIVATEIDRLAAAI